MFEEWIYYFGIKFIKEGYAKASAGVGVATIKGDGDGVLVANEWSILKLDVL